MMADDFEVKENVSRTHHDTDKDDDDTVEVKVLIPASAVEAIIGESEKRMPNLDNDSRCRVQMSKNHEVYPGTNERICLVKGKVSHVMVVMGSLAEKISETDTSRRQEAKLLIPATFELGMAIGNAISVIKNNVDGSGYHIEVFPKSASAEANERVVTVAHEDHAKLLEAVQVILEKVAAHPMHARSVDNRNHAEGNSQFNPMQGLGNNESFDSLQSTLRTSRLNETGERDFVTVRFRPEGGLVLDSTDDELINLIKLRDVEAASSKKGMRLAYLRSGKEQPARVNGFLRVQNMSLSAILRALSKHYKQETIFAKTDGTEVFIYSALKMRDATRVSGVSQTARLVEAAEYDKRAAQFRSEAAECEKKAAKCLKTSMVQLKFNPDYHEAIAAFERASVCYRNAGDLKKAAKVLQDAAGYYEQTRNGFHAAKAREDAAMLLRDAGDLAGAFALIEQAVNGYAECGSMDTAALSIDRGVKLVEKDEPGKAIMLYEKGLELVQQGDHSKLAVVFLSGITKFSLRVEDYPGALRSIRLEIEKYAEMKESGRIGQLATGAVLVQLARKDCVAALKEYGYVISLCPDFKHTDDAAACQSLIASYEAADDSAFQNALSRGNLRSLDNEFLRLQKKLKVHRKAVEKEDVLS